MNGVTAVLYIDVVRRGDRTVLSTILEFTHNTRGKPIPDYAGAQVPACPHIVVIAARKDGGALYAGEGTHISLQASAVSNNSAVFGGGLHFEACANGKSPFPPQTHMWCT